MSERSKEWIEARVSEAEVGNFRFDLEARELALVLVSVVKEIAQIEDIGGNFDRRNLSPIAQQWFSDFDLVSQQLRCRVRERALAKLTEEERAALRGWL